MQPPCETELLPYGGHRIPASKGNSQTNYGAPQPPHPPLWGQYMPMRYLIRSQTEQPAIPMNRMSSI